MQKRLYNIIAMAVIFAGISAAGNAQSIKAVINFTAPTQGLSVDPFRDKIYVVAPDPTAPSDNLAVINGASDTVIHNVQLPSGSLFVAVDYLAARIYVAGCNYNVVATMSSPSSKAPKKKSLGTFISMATRPRLLR
jgi:DNA-binding beta-propeller fold protein YncE